MANIDRCLSRAFLPAAGCAIGATRVAFAEHVPPEHWLRSFLNTYVAPVADYITPRGVIFVVIGIAIWACVYVFRGFDDRGEEGG